jgi:hypothetical protein
MLKKILLGVLGLSLLWVSPVLAKNGDDGEQELEFRGTVSAVSATELDLGTRTFVVDENTKYENSLGEDVTSAEIGVGSFVKVKAFLTDGILYAIEVEIESETSSPGSGGNEGGEGSEGGEGAEIVPLEFRGNVTALSAETLTLDSLELLIDESTEYEDLTGTHITAGLIVVGDFVKVKAIETEAGLYAKEVELENDSSSPEEGSGGGETSNGGNGGAGKPVVKETARSGLVAEAALDDGAKANVRSKNRTRDSNDRQRLTSKLFFPLPSSVPNLLDETAAQDASFILEILRAGDLLAQCFYEYDHTTTEEGIFGAELKIDVRSRLRKNGRRTLEAKKGTCDTDLSTEGIQLGIPNLKSGDSLEVYWLSGAEQLMFSGAVR